MLMSEEQQIFLKKVKHQKKIIFIIQIIILLLFLGLWQFCSANKIINPFIFSSPSRIFNKIVVLFKTGSLFKHIMYTFIEVMLAFVIGIGISFINAILLYLFTPLKKVMDPYLTIFNSLPKVSIGPILIIWFGANIKTIVIMGILVNFIISTLSLVSGFENINQNWILLFRSLKAKKKDMLRYLIIPGSLDNIITVLKVNISMSLIGVIMGEFLTSKMGLGYLIIYGTQIFDLDLVMASITLLLIISFILYKLVQMGLKRYN